MTEEDVFKETETIGRLMRIVPDPTTGFKFDIWFDYTRKLTNIISEGDLVAVPNFSDVDVYSICQIISALPTHFAMPQNLEGYPGFSMEAVKNASQDWLIQEAQSYEDTTKIVCKATPFNLQFKDLPIENIKELVLEKEKAVVMPGKEVKLLSNKMLNNIMNMEINIEKNNIEIGNLLDNDEVKLLLDVEFFIKLHFGVFGFTGVGKSNLLSTIIRKLLKSNDNVKIILFDLANEYAGLLIDLLSVTDIRASILNLDLDAIPKSFLNFVGEVVTPERPRTVMNSYFEENHGTNGEDRNEANSELTEEQKIEVITKDLLNVTLLPRTIDTEQIRSLLYPHLKKLIEEHKIKIMLQIINETLRSFIDRNKDETRLSPARISEINHNLETWLGDHLNSDLTPEIARIAVDILNTRIAGEDDTITKRCEHLIRSLSTIIRQSQIRIREEYSLTLGGLIDDLNDPSKKCLYIVTSDNPDDVRLFSERIVSELYESRKVEGRSSPLVLFMVDEADEFIPTGPAGTYSRSTRAIETIARRGRKYGLGIGLATQRVTYLNTSIMAQPHTYFVSRLPRQTDRERVAEAFSMDEDLFQQTFKFQKGDWLIMSHEALGIQGKPIPISVENAEDRITEFLSKPFGEYTLEDLNENDE